MVRCVLCGISADPESPFLDGAVYTVNPKTMRLAWMHGDCLGEELDQAESVASSKPEFDNLADEWFEKIL